MIKIDNVGYTYTHQHDHQKKKKAISEINLTISDGEFISIIGQNGSGKSTLAKLLNALLLPSEGDIWVIGMNTKEKQYLWDIRKNVGMVFQNPDNQLVASVVEEDVAFGPENLGVDPVTITKNVCEALKFVDMEDFKKIAPHMLSGGQKQRVAIAGVIAMRPRCIVLDEPTAMLDPVGREEVLNTILKLNHEEGITVILITHFMNEAVYADKVLTLNKGKVISYGTPREIFSNVEEIKNIGLDVPQVTELAGLLSDKGIIVKKDCLFIDEMVDEICQLLLKT